MQYYNFPVNTDIDSKIPAIITKIVSKKRIITMMRATRVLSILCVRGTKGRIIKFINIKAAIGIIESK